MSLDYAILGFLNYQPMSGYDLKKAFDGSVRHFWYADQSQIYRTLNRLYQGKLVDRTVVEGEDHPDRKVYSITEQGRQALRQWLLSEPQVDQPHSAPLIQIFFAGQFPDEVNLRIFQFADAMMQEMIERYAKIPESINTTYRKMCNSEREAYFWNATLDLGMRVAKAQQEWARDIIADLENHRVPQK
jgi:PadR family transcriptional regulator AphA